MEDWNNYDEWDIEEPMWKKAIDFANKYHVKAGQYRIGKDGEKIPYITHIYEVMKILTNEANITSDTVLTVAALKIQIVHLKILLMNLVKILQKQLIYYQEEKINHLMIILKRFLHQKNSHGLVL